jgi:ribulose-phosphate 3-epimerase
MSVNPGFGGQEFIPASIEKIRTLKRMASEKSLQVEIEVDGGVKLGNLDKVVAAGADILVMGSAFFNSGDYGATVRAFRETAKA